MLQFLCPELLGWKGADPLKTFLKTIDRKVLDPETRLKGITWAYMAFTSIFLIHHVYATVYQKTVLNGGKQLVVPFLLFALAGFFLGKLWKDKLFWVFAALFTLKVVRTAMFGEYAFMVSGSYFVLSAYVYFGVYAVARVIPRSSWRAFLSVHCFCWTLASVVFCFFGLKTAITGISIPNLGTEYFTIIADYVYKRLALIYQPVTSGLMLSFCMSFTILGCFLTKRKFLRLFYILASIILFFTASLTGTRTAYVLSGINVALILCIVLFDALKPDKASNLLIKAGKYLLIILISLITTGLIAYLQSRAVILQQHMQTHGGLLISTAHAEEAWFYTINQRDFVFSTNLDTMLNGRFFLWQNIFQVVFSSAENLFLGQSVYNTMIPVNEIRYELGYMGFYHCHSIYLQHLLENGLPAFLLYTSFIVTFFVHAVRIMKNRSLPFWQRVLPVTTILCALEGLIDNTCHVNFGYPQMTLLFLIAGFTITLSREEKKKKDALIS